MGWFWIFFAVAFLVMQLVSIILSLIQVTQTHRLLDLNDTKEFYNWMHAQEEFRSLNRVRTADPRDDRKLVFAWTVAYVKDGKHHETESAFSPKLAIRFFREAIQ